MVEKAIIREHLSQAERHVALGAQHIREQKERIVEFERSGHDTAAARDLLRIFEEMQVLHIADRDRLQQELVDNTDPRGE